MKREWTYLAALLPYTTVISASAAFGAAGDGWAGEASRPKAKNMDGDGDASDDQNSRDANGAGAAPDMVTPGELAVSDANGGPKSSGGELSGVNSGIASVPHSDGMYAPAATSEGGMHGYGGSGGGGGGGGGVSMVTTTIHVHGEAGGLENEGYVDPDPSDADAMMILLGGTAEGSGDGAASSGEVLFDVVDYGEITIGYGYAHYTANGSEGASADTFFDVTGADLVFHYDLENATGNSAYSSTYVLAIDFEGDYDFEQQVALNSEYWIDLLSQGPLANWVQIGSEEEADVAIDGNHAVMAVSASIQDVYPALVNSVFQAFEHVGSNSGMFAKSEQAQLSLSANATGIDTLVTGVGSIVEIEDHFSSVSGTAILIA